MEKIYGEEQVIEIDVGEILRELRRCFLMIFTIALLGGVTGAVYNSEIMTPKYQSTSMVSILPNENTPTSLADLQVGSQLARDYIVLYTSRPVLEDVVYDLQLSMTYGDLKERIHIENPAETRILSITVTDPDAVMAKNIVDAIAQIGSAYVGDIMEISAPKVIESGTISVVPSNLSMPICILIGAGAGFFIACFILAVRTILNDKIQSEEDIMKNLGMVTLAVIPERNRKTEKSRKRKEGR